ncbi:MAG: hypothetical protein AB7G80_05070 [Dongiaceae bacterium]
MKNFIRLANLGSGICLVFLVLVLTGLWPFASDEAALSDDLIIGVVTGWSVCFIAIFIITIILNLVAYGQSKEIRQQW